MKQIKLSIVTTLYHSSLYIYEFYKRITLAAEKITPSYEIIFVNDGSPDDSLAKAIKLLAQDKRIKIIDLSRNFGHYQAVMTGLELAQAENIFLIDSDLEESPEWLVDFWQEITAHPDLDAVYGVQKHRKGNWFEKISGKIFYYLFNKLSTVKIPINVLTI